MNFREEGTFTDICEDKTISLEVMVMVVVNGYDVDVNASSMRLLFY